MGKIDLKNADGLIQSISKKLNIPPDVLKKQLEEGKFDAAMNNMNKNEAAQFQQVMNNPKIIEKLISTPQAQAIYKKLTGGK